MSEFRLLAGGAAFVLATCAAPAGADTRKLDFRGFTEVSAAAGVDVTIRMGAFDVTMTGTQKEIDRTLVELDGARLKVRPKPGDWGWFSMGRLAKVTVTAPAFSSLSASGGADMYGDGLTLQDVETHVSGGADMKLSGKCVNLTASASGGADFDGRDLVCDAVDAHASGGADAIVNATKSAKSHASGGADIAVFGHPPVDEHETSGGGSVKSR